MAGRRRSGQAGVCPLAGRTVSGAGSALGLHLQWQRAGASRASSGRAARTAMYVPGMSVARCVVGCELGTRDDVPCRMKTRPTGVVATHASGSMTPSVVRAATITGLAAALLPLPQGCSAQQSTGALARYNLSSPAARFELPADLAEISGLALDGAGRLWAHQDERAFVFQLDPTNGRIAKSFRLGRNGVRGDFEGIAVAGSRMFLISSEGELFEFQDAADGSVVEHRRIDLGTSNECRELEGLDHDPRRDELLLVCKTPRGRPLRDQLLIFGAPLANGPTRAERRYTFPLTILEAHGREPELNPSGIAVHPETGSFFILASQQQLVVEIDRSGRVLGLAELDRGGHPQPEGIVFAPDGTLYISSEARDGQPLLSVYRPSTGSGSD